MWLIHVLSLEEANTSLWGCVQQSMPNTHQKIHKHIHNTNGIFIPVNTIPSRRCTIYYLGGRPAGQGVLPMKRATVLTCAVVTNWAVYGCPELRQRLCRSQGKEWRKKIKAQGKGKDYWNTTKRPGVGKVHCTLESTWIIKHTHDRISNRRT